MTAIGNACGIAALGVHTAILELYLVEQVRFHVHEIMELSYKFMPHQFQLDALQVGYVFLAQSVTFALSNFPAGLLTDKMVCVNLHVLAAVVERSIYVLLTLFRSQGFCNFM